MYGPVAEAARAAARQLVPQYGDRVEAEVEAAIYGIDAAKPPSQFFDPVAIGGLIVAVATLAWQVYNDIKSRARGRHRMSWRDELAMSGARRSTSQLPRRRSSRSSLSRSPSSATAVSRSQCAQTVKLSHEAAPPRLAPACSVQTLAGAAAGAVARGGVPRSADRTGIYQLVSRFWEQNGSGGTLPGTVRSGYRARPDPSDVQKRPMTAASPGCALSSHRRASSEL